MPLVDYQILIDDYVRDEEGKVSSTQRDDAITRGVQDYSKHKPNRKVQDVASDGTLLLALPPLWETDFSKIISLEYPTGNLPPTLIEFDRLYEDTSTTKILLKSSPNNTDNVRITYSIRHVVDILSDTIVADDLEAACRYAAADLCDQLSGLYSEEADSTLAADSIDHGEKARRFASRARDHRKRYHDLLGVDPKRNVAAGFVVDLDLPSSRGGDRLTHPGKYR
ncbi:MAG: hypothetical protein FVQ79_00695 [Planctomycetes bacterium]|nr:hypothetical protein [Planctomycetota bacterium]